jgi:hypothetical protein
VQPPTFAELIGALLGLASLAVVAYLAVSSTGDVRSLAVGALVAVVAAANGFFLRAKVVPPSPQIPGTSVVQSGVSQVSTSPERIRGP